MENSVPVTAAEPPKTNPLSKTAAPHSSTLRLKPVIRKPGEARPGATPLTAAAPKPAVPVEAGAGAADSDAVSQLKSVTARLKGITQQIPQQAILHKTGIIGDAEMSEAQRNAAKARTARISLSEAIGVSPVKEEPAAAATPMKTIRIKRPTGLPSAAAAAPAPAPAPEAETKATEPAAPVPLPPSMTQRKTIKIQRPSVGVKPTKLGIKKPEPPADDTVADVADIPDLPTAVPTLASAPAATEKDVPAFVGVLGLIVQFAACVVMGALAFWLYKDAQIF